MGFVKGQLVTVHEEHLHHVKESLTSFGGLDQDITIDTNTIFRIVCDPDDISPGISPVDKKLEIKKRNVKYVFVNFTWIIPLKILYRLSKSDLEMID